MKKLFFWVFPTLVALEFVVGGFTVKLFSERPHVLAKSTIIEKDQSELYDQQYASEDKLALQRYETSIAPDMMPSKVDSVFAATHHIITKKPVVFLTIDDGLTKSPEALSYIAGHRLNPTLFLTDSDINTDYSYFDAYQLYGLAIENHTLNHPHLRKLSYAAQKAEICGQTDKLMAVYRTRPNMFRPPYGEYNADTLRAVHDCGLSYLVSWSAKVDGGYIQYQQGDHLVAGDIVLMHFRPGIIDDLKAFYDGAKAQGLTPARLSDWLK